MGMTCKDMRLWRTQQIVLWLFVVLKIVYLFFSLDCLNILTLKSDIFFFVNIFIQFEKEAKFFSLPPSGLDPQPVACQTSALANCTSGA